MDTIEKEIIDKFQQLDPSARQRVLSFLEQLEGQRSLSALELMRLPPEHRKRQVQAAILSSADEDFEIFEAYSEEMMDE